MGKRDAAKRISAKKKPNVGIITYVAIERAADVPLDNLTALIGPFTNKLVLITGSEYDNNNHQVEIIRTTLKRRTLLISKIIEQTLTHVRILSKLRNAIDILIFFNASGLTLPLIFARVFKMKCLIVLTNLGAASASKAIRASGVRGQFSELVRLRIVEMFERFSYFLADELIVYSPSIMEDAKLLKYRTKIVVAHRHFVDFDVFRSKNNITHRDNVVGYAGRLTEEKGILNLVKAIPQILSERNDVQFLILGEGHLEDKIHSFVDTYALQGNVTLTGWVPHEELPEYLTHMKLLVLPSYGEGLPNIMLEAMACGTPVLASRVGAIKDVIEDGKNGFILANNAPRHIAQDVIRAISAPNLAQISKYALTCVRKEFTYAKASEAWSEIIYRERRE